jgi:lipoprotein-anchoring transpeptidase ErfK/SrfK
MSRTQREFHFVAGTRLLRAASQIKVAVPYVIGTAISIMPMLAAADARAGVVVRVYRAAQEMTVTVDGVPYATWAVSTARRGYRTPAGSFRPKRLEPIWYSSKYEYSAMPHSIFFAGGYAIHGTYAVASLGRAVSHGCVRLSPAHASMLFNLIGSEGRGHTRIVIR